MLGIEARSEEERRRYAELQVQAEARRVGKTLAYQRAYDAAWQRLFPGQPRVSLPGAKAQGAGNTGSGRLAVFVKADCAPCAARVQQLQAAGTAFDLYMVGSRQDDARIRQWAPRRASTRPGCAPAPSRSTTMRALAVARPARRSAGRGARGERPMAAAIGTPGRERRPSRVAIRCASAALLLATGGWALAALARAAAGLSTGGASCRRAGGGAVRGGLAESGAMLRGRLIPWPWTLNVAGSPQRYATRAEACAGCTVRSPTRRPIASTPASARSISATTRIATRSPASCWTRTATSPSLRKSCANSTRRARTGCLPSAATTGPPAGTRGALPAQCASAPDPRARPRRSRSNPPGHHAMNHIVLIAAIGLLSTTTVFAQTASAPLIVVEDRGGTPRCRTTGR